MSRQAEKEAHDQIVATLIAMSRQAETKEEGQIIAQLIQEQFEVTSNGKTTWVNSINGYCAARHCPVSGEIYIIDKESFVTKCETVKNETFADWCARVKKVYNVDVKVVCNKC